MDTSADDSVTTDTLGRRSGPRRQHTLEEKRQIVEETHVRGASVAVVARRHDLNPNQLFAWRRLHRQGLLKAETTQGSAELLPVKVSTPTLMPSKRARVPKESAAVGLEPGSASIEIKLASGHSLIVRGEVEAEHLVRVLDVLVRRG